jgi:hypothetical protein
MVCAPRDTALGDGLGCEMAYPSSKLDTTQRFSIVVCRVPHRCTAR